MADERINPFARRLQQLKDKDVADLKKQSDPYTRLPKEKPRYREGIRVRWVNLEREKTRLLTALHRDVEHLLLQSQRGVLSKDDSDKLIKYLRLVKDLDKIEKDAEEEMSDEELEKIIKQGE
jgi:hypothetical protein